MKTIFHEAKVVINTYQQLRNSSRITKLSSVQKLKQLIEVDPFIRKNLEIGMENSHETLKGHSITDFVQLINAGVQEPPAFTLLPLVAAPINIICCELMQTTNGRTLFSNPIFNKILVNILKDYNKFLKSPTSLKYMNQQQTTGWFSPLAQKHINYSEFQCNPSEKHYGFLSWNDFFTRKLRPQARPVYQCQNKNSDNFISHSCQMSPLQYPIMPLRNIKKNDRFWLKDQNYSLKDIFGSQHPEYADTFQGGTILQGFLSAFYYHRWHSPVDGQIIDNYLFEGNSFMNSSQFKPMELDTVASAQTLLAAVATRRIIVIEAKNPLIGKIGLVYIGMADISSCLSERKIGEKVARGQQIGLFEIGGSSHAIIFQKKAPLRFLKTFYNSKGQTQVQKINSLLAEVL